MKKKLGRGGITPPDGGTTADIPKNIEDYIRANNAHLQVILRNQAEQFAMLQFIFTHSCANSAYAIYPDSPEDRTAHRARQEALKEHMQSVAALAYKTDVHKTYIEVLMEKFH